MENESALRHFHPLVASWFAESIGAPTEIQMLAWPKIAAGEHILVAAPTGSGKTMAAFLWAINELATGKWPSGNLSVLYVSPLKALNNDIRKNLARPLVELKAVFGAAGERFPAIGAAVRSGDTPQSERRRMLRAPPEILVTTPESLNLLLSSHGGRSILTSIRTVILDEIHAVIDTRRGVHLITAIDRLVPLCGEFQRIALSATVRPLETVARFIGGYRASGDPREPEYHPRPVRIVSSSAKKNYALSVRVPEAAPGPEGPEPFWQPFVDEIRKSIARNRSTLIFANSRRLCEKLTHLLNLGQPAPVAYAHHGALSREIRSEVEKKLKAGELRAIVATSSLELGIDIGSLDEVVLLQAPLSFSSAIQRIGRAGHRVGEKSRGTLVPTDAPDILHSAVLAAGVLGQDIEAARPILCPLDILAQIVVSMTGVETLELDYLFSLLRTSYPYRTLGRRQFDLVIEMLAGRYAGSRLRELKPRIAVDKLENTAAARKGALQAVYFSGGAIPDRGYFHLRHKESGAKLGELDEEFVWEAKIGQVFTLGTQNWRIERITHNDVLVGPARVGAAAPPFWKAEENLRESHFSERIGEFLESADQLLQDPEVKEFLDTTHEEEKGAADRLKTLLLARSHALPQEFSDPSPVWESLGAGAMERLIGFLSKQKRATGRPLPHRRHLLIEHIGSAPGGYTGNQVVLHTILGGRINRPFAMALEAAWETRYGYRPEIYPANDSIMLQFPHEASGEEILSLVTEANFSGLIRKKLEGSGFFGARFRECAGRALLLPKSRINERVPLWLNRLKSRRLLEAVLQYEDFPILLEAWRTCLQDELDLEGLAKVLSGLGGGEIAWSESFMSTPSPMAQSIVWPQINQYMYRGDESISGKGSRLRADLLREVAAMPELRPRVSRELAESFQQKRTRLSPGYSPESARELLEWVKERLLVPEAEWENILLAMRRDHGLSPADLFLPGPARLARIHPPQAAGPLVVAIENLPRLSRGLGWDMDALPVSTVEAPKTISASRLREMTAGLENSDEPEPDELLTAILSEWLRFYAPVEIDFVRATLGVETDRPAMAVEALIEADGLVSGHLIKGEEREKICDRENYEVLLRLSRAAAVPSFTPLGIERLQPFLARWQGLVSHLDGPVRSGPDELFQRIEQLVSCPAPAQIWESEILPARLKAYDPAQLDEIFKESDLRWIGQPGKRVMFSFESDFDLLLEEDAPDAPSRVETARPYLQLVRSPAPEEAENDAELDRLLPGRGARYDFWTLSHLSGKNAADLAARLWKEVWRGKVTNDTFASLRHGIENDFRVRDPGALPARRSRLRRGSGRVAFSLWKGSLPMAGNWMRIEWPQREEGLLERAEREKDRARLLLDRYGIIFRELLQNELPPFAWGKIFRALRLMELSEEVLTGYFFEGASGPQFISREAFRMLQKKFPDDAVYWFCAVDPASVCGIGPDALKGKLPRRVPSSHLVYRGEHLVMDSRRSGKTLTFHVSEADPHMHSYLGLFHHLLTRSFQPMRRIVIETINGEDASASPYRGVFKAGFDLSVDYKNLVLYRKHACARDDCNVL